MLDYVLNTFPVVIDYVMKVFEALEVIFFGHNSFHLFLLFVHFIIPVKLVLGNDRGTEIQHLDSPYQVRGRPAGV
jgi:hypothetical protein